MSSGNKFIGWLKNLSMVAKFAFWSIVLLALVIITGVKASWNYQNASTTGYLDWQNQYKDIAYNLATDPAVKDATRATPVEVSQVTVLQFPLLMQNGTTQQRVDRCQSCHAGLLNPQMTAENIIKTVDHQTVRTEDVAAYLDSHPNTLRIVKTLGTHPGVDIEGESQRDLGVIHSAKYSYGVTVDHNLNDADAKDYQVQKYSMSKHPFATFGCTTCHYGSGRELVEENAHGLPDFWITPVLPAKHMDTACAQCHIHYNSKTFQITYLPPMQSVAVKVAANGVMQAMGTTAGGPSTMPYFGDAGMPVGIVTISNGLTQIGAAPLSNGGCILNYVIPPGTKPNLTLSYIPKEWDYAKKSWKDMPLVTAAFNPTTAMTTPVTLSGMMAGSLTISAAPPTSVPLMTRIVKGEKLFKDKACYGCHKIDGFSKGNVGPELTFEGRVALPATIEHQLWDPRYKVTSCVMPYFFSNRLINTDEMGQDEAAKKLDDIYANPNTSQYRNLIVDRRAVAIKKATIADPDTAESLELHGYIPNAAAQDDVDALVTFISSQTGTSYEGGQANRMETITAFNSAKPETVPTTVEEGKLLFASSGCYACHTLGDPNFKGDPRTDPKAFGGVAGPQLTWEGSRHSEEWLIKHYENPQDFVPNSIMPIFPFSDSQRKALSMYDQSLKSTNPGARPVTPDQDMPLPTLEKAGAVTPDVRYMNR